MKNWSFEHACRNWEMIMLILFLSMPNLVIFPYAFTRILPQYFNFNPIFSLVIFFVCITFLFALSFLPYSNLKLIIKTIIINHQPCAVKQHCTLQQLLNTKNITAIESASNSVTLEFHFHIFLETYFDLDSTYEINSIATISCIRKVKIIFMYLEYSQMFLI